MTRADLYAFLIAALTGAFFASVAWANVMATQQRNTERRIHMLRMRHIEQQHLNEMRKMEMIGDLIDAGFRKMKEPKDED